MTTVPARRHCAVGVCAGAVAAAPIDRFADVLVPESDRADVAAQPSARRREAHAARALLRRLLAETVGAVAAATPLGRFAHGKPYLVDRPDIGISLSHTDGWVAVAIHPDADVGVDIQAPTTVSEGLLRKCCTPTGRVVLAALPASGRAAEFARIWTVQEACVKATGEGIAGSPWTIPVEPDQRHGIWCGVRWVSLPDRWPLPVAFAHCARGDAGQPEGARRCPT